MIDFETLTLGEVAKLEDLSGQSITALENDDSPKGKLLAAMVFVASRRQGEPKKWNECLDMSFTAASAYLGLDQYQADGAQDQDGAAPDRGPFWGTHGQDQEDQDQGQEDREDFS